MSDLGMLLKYYIQIINQRTIIIIIILISYQISRKTNFEVDTFFI